MATGTLNKAMLILEALGQYGPMGVNELGRCTAIDKSAVSRILSRLKSHNFVRTLPESGKYDLGLRIFELGQAVTGRLPFRKAIIPHVEALAQQVGETAYAGSLKHGQIVYLADAVSRQALCLGPRTGIRRSPAADAVGQAILAFRTPAQVALDLKQAREAGVEGLPQLEKLLPELERMRARGYAVERDLEPGVVAVAVPLLTSGIPVSAALAIGGPAARLPRERVRAIAEILQREAELIVAEMGWQTPLDSAAGD
jgi:DNA-binding IclR family transcriptional regulator